MTLLWLIGLALLANGCWQYAKYLMVRTRIMLDPVLLEPAAYAEFIILAPVLNEETTLPTFLTDLNDLRYPRHRFQVVVITTEKEFADKDLSPTIEYLQNAISGVKFSNIALESIHYPYSDGHKSDQLQFAMSVLTERHGPSQLEQQFFLTLDADSRIHADTLMRFNSVIHEDIDLYQQPVLWFKNLPSLRSPLMRSFAFLQSFFTISYEIPMFTRRFIPWRLQHLVGHGLAIRGRHLLSTKGFPRLIEDIRQGRIATFLNKPVRLVPGFGLVETAKSYPVFLKQMSVWYCGFWLFFSDYRDALVIGGRRCVPRDLVHLLHGIFKGLRWLLKGILHLAGILTALCLKDSPLLCLFALSLLVSAVLPVWSVANDFSSQYQTTSMGENRHVTVWKLLLFAPITFMSPFPGLLWGLQKALHYYICGQTLLPKTER